jgi:hypothetical protein
MKKTGVQLVYSPDDLLILSADFKTVPPATSNARLSLTTCGPQLLETDAYD